MNDSLKFRYQSRALLIKEFRRLQINEGGLSLAASAVSLATKKQTEEADKGAKKLHLLLDIAKKYGAKEFVKSLTLACADIDNFVGGGAAIFQKGIAALQASMSKGKLSSGEENGLLKSTKFLAILENGFNKLESELEELESKLEELESDKDKSKAEKAEKAAEFKNQKEGEDANSILGNLGFTSYPGGGGSIEHIKKEIGDDEAKKENFQIIADLINIMDETFTSPSSGFFQSVIVKALTGIPYLKAGGEEEFFISLLSIPINGLKDLQKAARGRSDFNSLLDKGRTKAIKVGETIKTPDDFAAAVFRYAAKREQKYISDDEISKNFKNADAATKEKANDKFFEAIAKESNQHVDTVHIVIQNLLKTGMLKVNESKSFRQVFMTGKSLSKQISFLLQEDGNTSSSQGGDRKDKASEKPEAKSKEDNDPYSKLATNILEKSDDLKKAEVEQAAIVSILKKIPRAFLAL